MKIRKSVLKIMSVGLIMAVLVLGYGKSVNAAGQSGVRANYQSVSVKGNCYRPCYKPQKPHYCKPNYKPCYKPCYKPNHNSCYKPQYPNNCRPNYNPCYNYGRY